MSKRGGMDEINRIKIERKKKRGVYRMKGKTYIDAGEYGINSLGDVQRIFYGDNAMALPLLARYNPQLFGVDEAGQPVLVIKDGTQIYLPDAEKLKGKSVKQTEMNYVTGAAARYAAGMAGPGGLSTNVEAGGGQEQGTQEEGQQTNYGTSPEAVRNQDVRYQGPPKNIDGSLSGETARIPNDLATYQGAQQQRIQSFEGAETPLMYMGYKGALNVKPETNVVTGGGGGVMTPAQQVSLAEITKAYAPIDAKLMGLTMPAPMPEGYAALPGEGGGGYNPNGVVGNITMRGGVVPGGGGTYYRRRTRRWGYGGGRRPRASWLSQVGITTRIPGA